MIINLSLSLHLFVVCFVNLVHRQLTLLIFKQVVRFFENSCQPTLQNCFSVRRATATVSIFGEFGVFRRQIVALEI